MTYVLIETDFRNIERLNGLSLFLFSFGAIWLSIFISFVTGWMYAEKLSESIILLTRVVTYVSLLSTILCYVFGIYFFISRKRDVEEIKSQHKVREATIKRQ